MLLDLNWVPLEVSRWRDSAGEEWAMRPDAVANVRTADALLCKIKDDVVIMQWRASAAASDLVDGAPPCAAIHRKTWMRLIKEQKYDQAAMLVRVFAGGLWPLARAAAEMPAKRIDTTCKLCGSISEATLCHLKPF